MAITVVNKNKIFNKSNNLIIIFKNDNNTEEQTFVKKENDFIFIFLENKLIGINVLNYKKYFNDIKEGFHKINKNTINYLIKNFSKYINDENIFDDFYKIGLVEQIEIHPNNKNLKILKVTFKNNEVKKIITNVKEIKNNNKYLFALNGSVIYTGQNIVNSKILNVKSEGMILSYKSLGINKEGLVDCTNYNLNDSFDF